MKTTKYLLSALCLAALAAGCTKDTGMRTSSVEGLRISVTATTPSTRTSLHEDGLSLLWEEGDQLQLIPTNADNDNIYTLTLDEKSLSSDRTQADFVASQAIPQGEYYLPPRMPSLAWKATRIRSHSFTPTGRTWLPATLRSPMPPRIPTKAG